MSSMNLNYSRDDAKTLIKIALENTDGIKTYYDNGIKITGKTGFSLGSYGEKVIIEIPENQPDESTTMIHVSSKKEVEMNITSNPQKYEDRVVSFINHVRGMEIDAIIREYGKNIRQGDYKEVNSPEQQADGSSMLVPIIVLILVLTFLFGFMPILLI
jgi:hypothetical protein